MARAQQDLILMSSKCLIKVDKIMNREENDPDTLQLLDELDTDWVKLWRTSTNKKKTNQKRANFQSYSTRKKPIQWTRLQSKKTRWILNYRILFNIEEFT